jgi:hypothetical protein
VGTLKTASKHKIPTPQNLASFSRVRKTGAQLMRAMKLVSVLGRSEFHAANEFKDMKVNLIPEEYGYCPLICLIAVQSTRSLPSIS